MPLPSLHLPLRDALRGYGRPELRDDVLAGTTTAIMLVPQAMAYAMLAGLDPIIGLYASTLPLAVYALFGSSRQLAVGPVAMVSLLVASGVCALAAPGTPEFLALAILLSLMVGGLQLVMGLGRLGAVVNFLSHPVVAGFTSAAALIIGLSQLTHVLGFPIPRSHHVHDTVLHAVAHLDQTHPLTLAIAGGTLLALTVLKAWRPGFPRFLFVVVLGTALVWGLGLDARGVKIVGAVPAGLPSFGVPRIDLASLRALFPMAITIALVGFMESISVAKSFARKQGLEVDPDQELVALGLANLAGAFFHAYPVTGGFSRTAVNAQAGARTGVASLVTAAAVAITLIFLTPLFTFLPNAVLAAIIMSAVFGLIDVAEAKHLYKVSKPDLALMALTFVATLTLGIEEGIVVGVLASLAWFVRSVSHPHVAVLGRLEGRTVYRKLSRNPDAHAVPGALIVRIDAPLFFANTTFLKRTLTQLEASVQGALRAVVIDATSIGHIDASAAEALRDLQASYAARGVAFYLAGIRGPVRDQLDLSGFTRQAGEDVYVLRTHHAVQRILGDDGGHAGVAA